jgi:hypothetical protein
MPEWGLMSSFSISARRWQADHSARPRSPPGPCSRARCALGRAPSRPVGERRRHPGGRSGGRAPEQAVSRRCQPAVRPDDGNPQTPSRRPVRPARPRRRHRRVECGAQALTTVAEHGQRRSLGRVVLDFRRAQAAADRLRPTAQCRRRSPCVRAAQPPARSRALLAELPGLRRSRFSTWSPRCCSSAYAA